MGKFIPVEPEKWAEMVKAQAEVARLEALTSEMDKTINASQAECRRLKAEVERLALIVGADAIDREYGMCCDASAQVERLTIERNGFEQAMNGNITLLKMKRAHVERLTKAGDQLDDVVRSNLPTLQPEMRKEAKASIEAWFAAKKGGQP